MELSAVYIGDGKRSTFPITFPYGDHTQVRVKVIAEGVETPLSYGTDYKIIEACICCYVLAKNATLFIWFDGFIDEALQARDQRVEACKSAGLWEAEAAYHAEHSARIAAENTQKACADIDAKLAFFSTEIETVYNTYSNKIVSLGEHPQLTAIKLRLDDEVAKRASDDTALGATIQTGLQTETDNRNQLETSLRASIENETAARTGALSSLSNTLEVKTTELSNAVNALQVRIDNQQSIAAPMYNTREILTTSGDYTAKATGWARLLLIGGGGSGSSTGLTSYDSGGGGGAGEELEVFAYLTKDTVYNYTIGAGGAGVTDVSGQLKNGNNGGATSLTINGTTYTAAGGQGGTASSACFAGGSGGGSGLSAGQTGGGGIRGTSAGNCGGSGAGRGGGNGKFYNTDEGTIDAFGYGGGGAGSRTGSSSSNCITRTGSGYQGCIVIDYFNPNKAA